MKTKILNIILTIILILGVILLTRPCSIRPFQNKSCYQCGIEEGEKQAVDHWNKTHTKEYQVKY